MAIKAAICLITFIAAGQSQTYPKHWWTPIPQEQAASWEILPQAAKPGEVILSKRNELGILSNFAPTPFTFHGQRYASVEGFWQMMLYPEGPHDPRAKQGIQWPHTRGEVAQMTAFDAKDAGEAAEANMQKLGIDWVTFEGHRMPYRSKEKGEHHRLIVAAMRAKLGQNPKVRETLLATGNLILRPDHIQEPDPPAEWLYFKIWMDIRTALIRAGPYGRSDEATRPINLSREKERRFHQSREGYDLRLQVSVRGRSPKAQALEAQLATVGCRCETSAIVPIKPALGAIGAGGGVGR